MGSDKMKQILYSVAYSKRAGGRSRWMIFKDDGSKEYAVGMSKKKKDAVKKARKKAKNNRPSILLRPFNRSLLRIMVRDDLSLAF